MEFTIGFAGFYIRFILPTPIEIPIEFSAFLCDDTVKNNAEYEIRLLGKPLNITGQPVAFYKDMKIYPYKDGWLRLYSALTAEDGCQVACMINRNQKNILYYPLSKWNDYKKNFHCLHLLGIEEVLIQNNAFLLHSSVVEMHGRTILFSGSSGIGKSTQATLWKQCLDAEVLNGDRCIIRKDGNTFWGCGSPWCGTSLIYRNEQAPLKGIFILRQSRINTVKKMRSEAFLRLFEQCIVNPWNDQFVKKLMDLIAELLEQIPIYELGCRPDETAVRMAYSILFEGGI